MQLLGYIISVAIAVRQQGEILDALRETTDDVFPQGDVEHMESNWRGLTMTAIITMTLITAAWVYPMIMLMKEIRDGIMKPETRLREEYSCCCTGFHF